MEDKLTIWKLTNKNYIYKINNLKGPTTKTITHSKIFCRRAVIIYMVM